MSEEKYGRIVQIIGPVIDVAFDDESQLPNLLDALEIEFASSVTCIVIEEYVAEYVCAVNDVLVEPPLKFSRKSTSLTAKSAPHTLPTPTMRSIVNTIARRLGIATNELKKELKFFIIAKFYMFHAAKLLFKFSVFLYLSLGILSVSLRRSPYEVPMKSL